MTVTGLWPDGERGSGTSRTVLASIVAGSGTAR